MAFQASPQTAEHVLAKFLAVIYCMTKVHGYGLIQLDFLGSVPPSEAGTFPPTTKSGKKYLTPS